MTRAVLEGVAFGIKDSFTLIQEAGLGEINQVRISGGGAKSPLWRQIMADVLGVELVTVNTTEGAAFGAALLAGVAAGLYASVEDGLPRDDSDSPAAPNRARTKAALPALLRALPRALPGAGARISSDWRLVISGQQSDVSF